jgi:N-acetylmuramoyl-L-alanine amidase
MYIRVITLIFAILCVYPVSVYSNGKKVTNIVLDAGHGGSDPGAKGQISLEKNLTLAIALRVGKIINDSLKDCKVIYTRTSDVYPTLKERHEIANRAKGDLFVSIHINATAPRVERIQTGYKYVKKGNKKVKVPTYRTVRHTTTTASGTETFVLGLHRSNQKAGAIGEHAENIVEEPGLLDENDPQTAIIIAQYNQAFLSKSVTLGTRIQSEFERIGRKNLGVKQMGLEVLAGSAMPGVLVECGFINNPEEEAYMNSEQGQQELAMAIFRGIRAYKLEAERN